MFKEELSKIMEDTEYSFEECTVNKTSNSYIGLRFRKENCNIMPVLNPEDFKGAKDMFDEVINRFCQLTGLMAEPKPKKENLVVCALGLNETLPEDAVFKKLMDITLYIRCNFPELSDGGVASAVITRSLLNFLNISANEAFDIAEKNLANDMKIQLMSELFDICDNFSIVSNSSRLHGAGIIGCKKSLCEFYDEYGSFVIIPSSIHELLFIPCEPDTNSFNAFRNMVADVNGDPEAIDSKDVLSNSVYFYDGKTIRIV